jgi:transketolase
MAHDLPNRAHSIRRTVLEIALGAGTCHIGCALSIVDILATLYFDVLRDPSDGGDRFVLSKGHAASALYATLAETGVLQRDEVIAEYCRDGGRYAGHPERHTPGVEATGGSLGHGLAVAAGLALADRADGADRRTYCLLGDGELNEGSVWEALALAAHLQLGTLCAIVDANGLQGLGDVRDVCSFEPLGARFETFGWRVYDVAGHDHAALGRALTSLAPDVPTVVIARTVKGYGVDFMENDFRWHYRPLRPEDRERTLQALERGRAAA